MIRNKKAVFLLIILFIVFYIIVSVIFSIPKGKKVNHTVFLGNFSKVSVIDGKISVNDENFEISKQKVKIHFKNSFIDGYIFSNKVDFDNSTNEYVISNEDGEYLSLESSAIAYTPDISIKVKEKTMNDSNNLSDVYSLAKKINIPFSNNLLLDYLNVSNVDIDDDGQEEYIYSVGLIEDSETYKSLIFLITNNKYYLLDTEESTYDEVSNVRLRFFNLIDFNNDDNYEFVVEKIMSEYGPVYYELYNFNGNSFTKIE